MKCCEMHQRWGRTGAFSKGGGGGDSVRLWWTMVGPLVVFERVFVAIIDAEYRFCIGIPYEPEMGNSVLLIESKTNIIVGRRDSQQLLKLNETWNGQ